MLKILSLYDVSVNTCIYIKYMYFLDQKSSRYVFYYNFLDIHDKELCIRTNSVHIHAMTNSCIVSKYELLGAHKYFRLVN